MMKQYWLLLLCLCMAVTVQAQTSATVKKLESQRRAALKEIDETNSLLKKTTRTADNFLKRLNLLSNQITSRKKVINLLTQEVSAMDREMREMNKDIDLLEKELKAKQQNYAKSARQMYKRRSSQDKLLYILSASNFTQSIRRIRYLREYANWQIKQGEEVIAKRTEINKKQEDLKQKQKEKKSLLNNRETENKNLEAQEQVQKAEVKTLSTKKKELQAVLSKKKKQAQALNKQIENQIAIEIARAEEKARQERLLAEKRRKEQLAAAKKAGKKVPAKDKIPAEEQRKAAVKGGYAMTKVERKLSGDFANNKGRLPYPVSGRHTIVSRFGEQQHQELKYVRTNNNGIDLQVPPGSDARAIFDGEVTRVFVLPGYNNSIIVRHGNYLTVYSNITKLYVKAGDKVKARQAIGKIYSDSEDNNSTILHFQVWKERTKLNPLLWLD
jgi:septal ring factor EnvC (AmiA/AmiB activator)